MYAIITNSMLGKSVNFENVYSFDEYYNAGYDYGILEIKAEKGDKTVADLIKELDFAIETVEIHDLKMNEETGEVSDVIIITYDNYHVLDKVTSTYDPVVEKVVNSIQLV